MLASFVQLPGGGHGHTATGTTWSHPSLPSTVTIIMSILALKLINFTLISLPDDDMCYIVNSGTPVPALTKN